jgi:hypothetical protein
LDILFRTHTHTHTETNSTALYSVIITAGQIYPVRRVPSVFPKYSNAGRQARTHAGRHAGRQAGRQAGTRQAGRHQEGRQIRTVHVCVSFKCSNVQVLPASALAVCTRDPRRYFPLIPVAALCRGARGDCRVRLYVESVTDMTYTVDFARWTALERLDRAP